MGTKARALVHVTLGAALTMIASASRSDTLTDYGVNGPIAMNPPSSAMPADVATLVASPEDQAAAAFYWTRQEISDAPAFPMPIDFSMMETFGPTAPELSAVDEETALNEPSGAVEPSPPARDADAIARTIYADDWAIIEEEMLSEHEQDVWQSEELQQDESYGDTTVDVPAGASQIYISYDVNTKTSLWQVFPHRWSGKLTFTTPSGNSSCSATAIGGNNFVTAAHCVYDTTNNRWYNNWVFTPAYRNGATPYGSFSWTACTIPNQWIALSGSYSINTWARHDVAVCTAGRNSAGQTLNQAVGNAGYAYGQGWIRVFFNSGYPAQNYLLQTISNGPAQYLRACTAESRLHTTRTLGMGCNWGPGISGGAWLLNYKPDEVSGFVNSVNSGLYVGQQNIFGAKFDAYNFVPLCNARGC